MPTGLDDEGSQILTRDGVCPPLSSAMMKRSMMLTKSNMGRIPIADFMVNSVLLYVYLKVN